MTLEEIQKQYREVIFVFASNKAGRHGAGAARVALRAYGAKYGQGQGLQGRSYAIPTKGWDMEVLPLSQIQNFVQDFIQFAREYGQTKPDIAFRVTAIATGLAGYKHEQIAPLFRGSPSNCFLPERWSPILRNSSVGPGLECFIRR